MCHTGSVDVIYNNVDAATFKLLIEKKDGVVVDLRKPEEVVLGKIEGSINLDYSNHDFKKKVLHLDKSKPVYVYCESGGRSGRAMSKMRKVGFKIIYNLDGGFSTWKSCGYPIEI